MKILINTINDYNNYGNRFQNYALQEILKNYGHEVYTLRNYHESKKKIKITHTFYLNVLKKIFSKIIYEINGKNKLNRERNFNFRRL